MSAGNDLQTAVVLAALQISGLTGVFDGPPARAEFPYLVVDCGAEKDWSTLAEEGREVALRLTLWDREAARLLLIEQALEDLTLPDRQLPGWYLSSLVFVEKTKVRSADGPWALNLSMRARLLKRS